MTGGWFKVNRRDRDTITLHCGEKTPGVLAVWIAFCDLANRSKSSDLKCSTAEIGRIAGVTSRTVERSIPILRDLGLLTWVRSINPTTGGIEANHYHLDSFRPSDAMSGDHTPSPPTQSRKPSDNFVGESCRSLYSKTVKTDKILSAPERISSEKELRRLEGSLKEMLAAGTREQGESGFTTRKIDLQVRVAELRERLSI